MDKRVRGANVVLGLIILFIIAYFFFLFNQNAAQKISYSQLLADIQGKRVIEVKIDRDSAEARGRYAANVTIEGKPVTNFIVVLPPDYSQLLKVLGDNGVTTTIDKGSALSAIFNFQTIFFVIITMSIVGWFILIYSRQVQAGGTTQAFTFGKSRARRASESKNHVTFADVAGVDEAIEELREVVDFLKDPRKYAALGAEIPKGVLLVGPPGCGKTLLAKAVAGESGVPFYYISGSDFVEMFVGVGASRVRDLFDTAKKTAPCLVFVDELDAVGRHRGAGLGGGHDEREQTLNQLLVELDGFERNSGVILLAATNRPDVLDPALLRPGRFDRHVVVDRPDLRGREQIWRIHLRNKPVTSALSVEILARRTPGFTGADIANASNEAALLAARHSKSLIDMADFEEAVDKVVAGPERKSRVISDKEKLVIAYHELGHAFVAYSLPDFDPVHKVSILPRGMALGYTLSLPDEDRFLSTKEHMLNVITFALGGRAAEEIKFKEITTGAQNDLERSTQLARAMVTQYGMSKDLGPITFGHKHESIFLGRDLAEERNYSEQVAYSIDQEVKGIISQCHEKAKAIVSGSLHIIDNLAKVLIEKEHLEREEFESLIAGLKGLPSPPPTPAPYPAPA